MTFALVPSVAYADNFGTIDAYVLNYWRVCVAQAIDGTAGGPYTPANQIGIAGAGLKLSGLTALELDATSVCKQDAGGVFNVSGEFDFLNGSLAQFENGAQLNMAAGSAITVYGQCLIESGGTLYVHSSGLAEVASGGTLKVDAGGSLNLYGTESVESGGIVDVLSGGLVKVESGGEIEVKIGATLQGDAGSSFNLGGTNDLSGTNTLSGATTQSNKYTKSGAGAYTVERLLALTNTGGTHTVANPQDYDVIYITGTSADTIALSMPGGLPDGVRVRICQPGPVGAGSTTVTGVANNSYSPVLSSTAPACSFIDLESVTISATSQWVVVAGGSL